MSRKSVFYTFLLVLGVVIVLLTLIFNRADKSIHPLSFSQVTHPDDNPFSKDKAKLGELLFFDERLSLNNEISCASCHDPSLYFTDKKSKSVGVEGRVAFRNAPSLFNVGFLNRFMYDGEVKSLEEQVLVPILDHSEMGMNMKEVIKKLSEDEKYQSMSMKIFNRKIDAWVITRSIACYERTLISNESKFDAYYYNQKDVLNESEYRGWKLFSDKLNCIVCHQLPLFTSGKNENNGISVLGTDDLGRYRITHDSLDIGSFKVPSLRNVSNTAPYMHDGRFISLDQVIDYYNAGGEEKDNKSTLIFPLSLTHEEKSDLLSFLKVI